jgi:L-ascorbate metabolism protein UlaG (beta-lactamase superfamily)
MTAVAAIAAAGVVVYACGPWRRPVAAPVRPDPRSWSADDLTIAYIGHASVLIDFAGTRILTDPAFFARVGIQVAGVTIGPTRVVRAALAPEDLPPIAAVLVSHAHMDSLDRPSLERLTAAPLLVTPRQTRDLVDDLGFARVVELGWGEHVEVGDVNIEAVPVNHWGKRWPWDGWRGYNGYLLTKGEHRVLFASDTAYTEAFGALAHAPRIDVAIFGIGAYDPWIMNHADPEQAWRMFTMTGACYLVPVHWDTFRLGKEPLGEALARLLVAAGSEQARVAIRRTGDTFVVPRAGCDPAPAPAASLSDATPIASAASGGEVNK